MFAYSDNDEMAGWASQVWQPFMSLLITSMLFNRSCVSNGLLLGAQKAVNGFAWKFMLTGHLPLFIV